MIVEIGRGFGLREIRRADRDALIEHLNDRGIYDQTLRIPFPYTAADADGWFDFVEKQTRENGRPTNWAIHDATDRLIGGIGLEGAGLGRSHRMELGYWLAKPLWGRGIMTAAVDEVCRHALADLGLEKITAHVFSFNNASARVLEKCGFEPEGYLKRHFVKDGKPLDARAFGRLKSAG